MIPNSPATLKDISKADLEEAAKMIQCGCGAEETTSLEAKFRLKWLLTTCFVICSVLKPHLSLDLGSFKTKRRKRGLGF